MRAAGDGTIGLVSSNRRMGFMSAPQIELNDRQRDLLLRGLRFVRSSRMLGFRETQDISEEERQEELREIAALRQLLEADSQPATV